MIDIRETRDIAACRALRRIVFIEEQGVSEADEVDDKDDDAIHLLATLDGKPVGSARLLVLGEVGKVGRVCVLAEARGTGLGAALMRGGRAVPGCAGGDEGQAWRADPCLGVLRAAGISGPWARV